MNNQQRKWVYLIGLAIIWGSSFILIKKGLVGLTPYQLGALRMVMTASFLLAYNFKSVFEIPRDKWKWILITALLSTFFPVFLFAHAQTQIDSSIVAVLNSLVPLFAMLIGAAFFRTKVLKKQILGVFIGLAGTAILILQGATIGENQNYLYSLLVVVGSIGYASNINILKYKLSEVSAIAITTGNFLLLLIPAILILLFTDFFDRELLANPVIQQSIFYIALLSLFGTAIAKVLFNELIKISSPVFSASVTYLIPVVAILWGLFDGERFVYMQILGALTILIGVYLVNKKKGEA